jgi:hypothetical protein
MLPSLQLSPALCGVAGEYFVAAELTRRGYVASITLRNTRGIDILASNADATRAVGIQVKTKQGPGAEWLLSAKAEEAPGSPVSDHLFYVFVNLNGIAAPTYHVVPREAVAAYARETHRQWLASPGRNGRARRDSSMRKFRDPDGQYRDRWDSLGLDAPGWRRGQAAEGSPLATTAPGA